MLYGLVGPKHLRTGVTQEHQTEMLYHTLCFLQASRLQSGHTLLCGKGRKGQRLFSELLENSFPGVSM